MAGALDKTEFSSRGIVIVDDLDFPCYICHPKGIPLRNDCASHVLTNQQ